MVVQSTPRRPPTITEINRAIKSRETKIDPLKTTLESLEDICEKTSSRLREIEVETGRTGATVELKREKAVLDERLRVTTERIDRNIRQVAKHNGDIEQLRKFRDAMLHVAKGLPPDLLET